MRFQLLFLFFLVSALSQQLAQTQSPDSDFDDSALPSLPVRYEPFASLEHVNLHAGPTLNEDFWLEVLGCVLDPRSPAVLERTNAARAKLGQALVGDQVWANIGLQQFHLPIADGLEVAYPEGQKLRGVIHLAWPAAGLSTLRERLHSRGLLLPPLSSPSSSSPQERQQQHQQEEPLRFIGPNGNRFVAEAVEEALWFGPREGLGPGLPSSQGLPGGLSEGLGIRAVAFDVPAGTAARICHFYASVFDAHAVFSEGRSSTKQDDKGKKKEVEKQDSRPNCTVSVGFAQSLQFLELAAGVELEPYDGHHVALYVNGRAWSDAYERAAALGAVWSNPRFPQFRCGSLREAREHHEWRLLDVVDPLSGAPLFRLEHEVRTLRHPGFLLGYLLDAAESEVKSEAKSEAALEEETEAEAETEAATSRSDL